MTYLIVGLDRSTLTPWHRHVLAHDPDAATRIARTRAAAQGVQLVIAAVIGPATTVLADPGTTSAAASQAA